MADGAHRHLRHFRLPLAAWLVALWSVMAGAGEPQGRPLFQAKCAACHGAEGEGTPDNPRALAGDRPVGELAEVIAQTMPEDDPGSLSPDESHLIAAYIYDAFYSKIAQARRQKARIELSRLTVRQYAHTVADLVGSFREPGTWDQERGLEAEYYDGRNFRRDKRLLERRDPQVAFSFGADSPVPDKGGKEEFSIRWEGSLLPLDTGDYEFIVQTENGTRLWVNDTEEPLIDAWVKSGNDSEYRQVRRLLGGRAYPLRLDFLKAKEKTASIRLLWKPPGRMAEVIPERQLSPRRQPSLLVIQTPFPPDDRSVGYERGTSISQEWDQATTYAAIEVADYVGRNLGQLTGERGGPSAERVRDFCRQFAARAFRRPLPPEEQQFFVDRWFEDAQDPRAALKKSILLVLKSPRFLYRDLPSSQPDAYDLAARLSFTLWDSLPDRALEKAAAQGELETPEQLEAQAQRMLADLRAQAKLREFFQQWLKLDQIHDLSKDKELFPEFDESIASDLRTSLELFVEDVLGSESSDFRQLLLADYLFLNGRLAPLYGIELPGDAPFQKVAFDPQQRAGVLSHPYLLTSFAYHSTSSPIHRGVFIARSVLGRSLRPPPEAVAPLSPDLHAGLTTRERTALQTGAASCQTCHGMINPLGFALEHYDPLGRFRAEEKGKPIDALGSYRTLAGERIEFQGVRPMASFLAGSQETSAAFVEQLFHYLVKQPIRAYGPDQPAALQRTFVERDYSIRYLATEIVKVAGRAPLPPTEESSPAAPAGGDTHGS